jgi:hypothetical protein
MGYVLASEFLRNLHWGAFKPDRHFKRLFQHWCPSALSLVEPEVQDLQRQLGRHAADLADYFRYSLVGIDATPKGTSITYADNSVWLLAANVERKGKETNVTYVKC